MKTNHIITLVIVLITLSTSCVQKKHLKTVTFQVDMNHIENVDKVGITGEFTDNPWVDILQLTDENGDGIYEITVSEETAANIVEFKFLHNGIFELEGKNNRVLQMEYKPETLLYQAKFDMPNE